MKVIPMRRPTPRPQPARPTPVAQPKPPPPRQVAAPAPPPPEPAADPTRSRRIRGLERRRETARKDQRLWLVVAGAACFLLLVVLFVVFALSVES
jgi:hypothetical protein